MKNVFGNNVSITVFGESHGPAIGVVIDGLAPGLTVDTDYINKLLTLRRPSGAISTPRHEADEFVIESGVFEGKTTGTPLCILIPNEDTRSKDYSATRNLLRPSHADYTADCKYHGYQDYRGGGHFSGRITAALVAAGGIVMPALNKKGIRIGTHIKRCGGISDIDFSDAMESEIDSLNEKDFAVLDDSVKEKMTEAILTAKKDGNSVGGVLETAVTGLDAGLGEPMFDSIESVLSHALFSIPAIKGVEFGAGFAIADMTGKEANDAFCNNDGKICTATNNSGGINGGITNGMPLVFRCAVKPTPSIAKSQNTVDFTSGEEVVLSVSGRHDPCIVHRARVVVDSVVAIVLCDLLSQKFGTDWLV